MSRATLRRIRRLSKKAAPLIAELDRRQKAYEKSLPSQAENHLLSVIWVFRYGEPRIDEPLALAYDRAMSKAKVNTVGLVRFVPDEDDEDTSLDRMREILEKEPPGGDIRSKISICIRQVPYWLRRLCSTNLSMRLLGLEILPIPEDFKLELSKSDRDAWPSLPQGILEPRRHYGTELRFIEQMSAVELTSFIEIQKKPQDEWTRQELRFIREIRARGRQDKHD